MSRGQELVTMDFLGIEKSKKMASENKYCTPGLNEKSIHWIKPQMVLQAFSSRGLSEEYCKGPRDTQVPKFEAASRIMKELFPQHTGPGSNPTTEQNAAGTLCNSSVGRSAYTTPPGKQSAAQLTIFYNGTVNVYDVSETQAKDVIRLAGIESSSQELHSASFDRHTPAKLIKISSTSTSYQTEEALPMNSSKNSNPQQVLIRKLHTDLPLQRKQSLQRFLQNRKEYRMNRVSPYSHCQTQSLPKKEVD